MHTSTQPKMNQYRLVGMLERVDPVGREDAVRAVRSARQALPAVRDRPDELADAEREQREVELPAAEDDEADDEPGCTAPISGVSASANSGLPRIGASCVKETATR